MVQIIGLSFGDLAWEYKPERKLISVGISDTEKFSEIVFALEEHFRYFNPETNIEQGIPAGLILAVPRQNRIDRFEILEIKRLHREEISGSRICLFLFTDEQPWG